MNEILQVLLEPHEIQERALLPKCHEQVQIAAFAAFTSPGEEVPGFFLAPEGRQQTHRLPNLVPPRWGWGILLSS
jgi:hypothetical protein